MIGILFYTIAIFINGDYNNIYGLVGLIVIGVCLLHILGMFGFGSVYFATAIWQKISVYALVFWSVFQGYYLLKTFDQ
jgi:hypothetical protein